MYETVYNPTKPYINVYEDISRTFKIWYLKNFFFFFEHTFYENFNGLRIYQIIQKSLRNSFLSSVKI